MPTLRKSLAGALDRSAPTTRIRKRTPPKIRDYKPPLPLEPPPVHTPASVPTTPRLGATPTLSASMRTMSLGAFTVAGYLAKQGEIPNFLGRHTWKRRWFVLEKGEMMYYVDQQTYERGEKPMKNQRVPVSDYVVMPDYDGADIVLLPSGSTDAGATAAARHSDRVWKFVCDSREDVDKWTKGFVTHGATLSPLSSVTAAGASALARR